MAGLASLLPFALAVAVPGPAAVNAVQVAPLAPAAPPTAATAANNAELLGFNDDNERMSVPVTISGGGPYRFIVDTGSERTVISRELAGTLGLSPGRDVRVTAMSGTSNVGTVVIPTISVSSLGGTRIEAPALEARNLGAAGLLGIDTLQGHAVAIDFTRRQMTIVPSEKRRHHERVAPDEIIVHAKSLLGQLVVTDAYYQGRRIQVILDTGSVVSMGNLALRKQVARGVRNLQPIALLGVTGTVLQADYAQVPQVVVAGVRFSSLPIAFADAAPFARFNLLRRPALMLGMDALKSFKRVAIDFPNREIRLALPAEVAANQP